MPITTSAQLQTQLQPQPGRAVCVPPRERELHLQKPVSLVRGNLEITEEQLEKLFEYNQINNKVNKLMAKRDLLIDKDATNQTIKKARQLIKKKIEFHKYWIDKLYNITFYTHLILILLLFIMLFYKLL